MKKELLLREYRPRPMLRVESHWVTKPRFPVVDIHNHSEWQGTWQVTDVPWLVEEMDKAGVVARVDLDGGNGERLRRHLEVFRERWPDRFVIFASLEWEKHLEYDDFGERMAKELEVSIKAGAEGLKVWKNLGLTLRDNRGRLIPVDDPRLDPIFEVAGAAHIPVLIHVADPLAFFEPLDEYNERYEELLAHPDWHFYGPSFPRFDDLYAQFERRVARHPETQFVGAHVGSLAEDLRRLGGLLDRYANLRVDVAARVAELGRQPYTARDFLIRYADRVLFGLDSWPAEAEEYRIYYRFFETRDEYFPYWLPSEDYGGSGRWWIYGVDLPDAVLQRIYYANAVTLIPRLGPLVDRHLRGNP
ncbi:MAG: amidohydrolase family protein [Firmicutes bacterium]|nr:amidohydrolase family protein [Bacillota bacterium]